MVRLSPRSADCVPRVRGAVYDDRLSAGQLRLAAPLAFNPFRLRCRVAAYLPKRFCSRFFGAFRIFFAALAGTASSDGGEMGCGPPGPPRAMAS